MKLLFLIFILIVPTASFAVELVPEFAGTVSALTGKASRTSLDNKKTELKIGSQVYSGDNIITELNSSIKLSLQDQSEMTLGPQSQFKIEAFEKKEVSTFSLAAGWLRAKVTKSLSQDTKLIIKTPTSAMGVRGTEFEAVTNNKLGATSLVTIDGSVNFTRVEAGQNLTKSDLLSILNDSSRVVTVSPGQFSGISATQTIPTIPVKISPAQFENLKVSTPFDVVTSKPASQAPQKNFISTVPPGIDAKLVAAPAPQELKGLGLIDTQRTTGMVSIDGFFDAKSGKIAPPPGGFFHRETGMLISPPPGSTFDPITQVYVPPKTMGTFSDKGDYVAPSGLRVDATQGLVQETTQPKGARSPTPGASRLANEINVFLGVSSLEALGKTNMAAPPPPGENAMQFLSRPGFIPPPATQIMVEGYGNNAVTLGSMMNKGRPAFYSNFQPMYPVYNSFLCPPYCDPRFQPGTYFGQPDHGTSTVNFSIQ